MEEFLKRGSEVSVGEYMRRYRKQMEEAFGDEAVVLKWKEIVGPVLFPHVWLETIDVENMEVRIDHPAYRNAFMMRQKMIIGKIHELFPRYEIKNVRIHLS